MFLRFDLDILKLSVHKKCPWTYLHTLLARTVSVSAVTEIFASAHIFSACLAGQVVNQFLRTDLRYGKSCDLSLYSRPRLGPHSGVYNSQLHAPQHGALNF